MSNRGPASNSYGDIYNHQSPSMNYFNRFIDRYSPSRLRLFISHATNPPVSLPPPPPPPRHQFHSSDTIRRRKHHHHKMTSFNGPWSTDLDAFKKSVQSMPEQYKASFSSASKTTVEVICDPLILHVWESDSDIDSLLQLTSVIAKLCDLGVRKNPDIRTKAHDGSMLIIAEEKSGRDNYRRICKLVGYLTEEDEKSHLEGAVCVFGKIVVVKGWNNTIVPTGTGNKEAAEKVVKRINVAIDRTFIMGGFDSSKRKIVWHHGPAIPFLLHWINTTIPPLRSAISAITITGYLDLRNRVVPSPAGRKNQLPDLQRLESYAKKLSIPVVFLDSHSQLIISDYLGTYMYFFAYYINTFLPPSLLRLHLGKAQDELVTFAFQLRGASENKYGSDVVRMVQKHLEASKARAWARMCVSKETYDKTRCRAAGKEEAIHHAVQLADSPFALFTHHSNSGIPAFARLAVGPASPTSSEYHIAAPVQISFQQARLRPSNPASFHILLPAHNQTVEKVTNRIQGLMMAVLERVRQEKGSPMLGETEKGMWKAVVKACTWAIEGCESGKMPKGVEEKVKFVREKLREGTWGYALGAPGEGGKGVAANGCAAYAYVTWWAYSEPNRSYGFGQGYGAGQTMGMYGNGGEQQVMSASQQGYPQQQSQGQLQGMRVDPGMVSQGHGYVFAQGQGQGHGQAQNLLPSPVAYAPQQQHQQPQHMNNGGYVPGTAYQRWRRSSSSVSAKHGWTMVRQT